MKQVKFFRNGKTIMEVPKGTIHHNSINKAKKKSREIQLSEDGALGRGTVRVEL